MLRSDNLSTLRKTGFVLFAVSFITPNWRFEGMGLGAFLEVPHLVGLKLLEGDFYDWRMVILLGSLSLGWLSNFSVFYPLPRFVSITAISAPWMLLLAQIFVGQTTGLDTRVIGFIPFYPWALGIGLVNLSRLIKTRAAA